jgi:hypothetical protein
MIPNNKASFPPIPQHYRGIQKTFNLPDDILSTISQYYYIQNFQTKQTQLSLALHLPSQLPGKAKYIAIQAICDSHENSDSNHDEVFNDHYVAYYHHFNNTGCQIYSPNFFDEDMINCCDDQFPCFTYYRGIEYKPFFPNINLLEHLWCHNCNEWSHMS